MVRRTGQRKMRLISLIVLTGIAWFVNSPSEGLAQYGQFSAADPSGAAFLDTGAGDAYNENAYLIGPNNLLHIRILNEGGLQQTFRVDDMGFISHPLVGRIRLGGMTVSQAEDRMRSMLDGDYIINPHVTIFVLEHSRFSVLGEVRKPGNYEIIGRLTLVEAISMAGGFTPVANESKVNVVRQGEEGELTLVVSVKDIMEGKKEDNVYIEAGDVINVPKSFF